MGPKLSLRCSDRPVTKNSTLMIKCNTKRSHPPLQPPIPAIPSLSPQSSIPYTDKQAFVIHCSHSSITIYYAKLPNTYLREISQHGHEYLTASTYKQRIQLRRTKKFRMQMTEERVELFRLLA